MIRDSIGNIFDFLLETNLVEEDFYNHKGDYPVFSGQTEHEGIIAFIDSYNQDEPCITFTTYGSAGKMYYRDGKYTIGRNCMGLRPKDTFKDKINLKWFACRFQNLFYRLRIGPSEGQRSLNKLLLENVEIVIPDDNIQERELVSYKKARALLDNVNGLLQKCESVLTSSILVTEYVYDETIGKLFFIIGGNNGLTKEFIYYNLPNTKEESVPILSGATIKANLMGYIRREAKPNGKRLRIFGEPCALVTRNGVYAGTISYMSNGEFTTNDHAYVFVLRPEWKGKLNLRWFAYQFQGLFYNLVTSKSDNATFNKEYAEIQRVQIPKEAIQDGVAEKLLNIDQTIKNLDNMREQLENLLEYEIT